MEAPGQAGGWREEWGNQAEAETGVNEWRNHKELALSITGAGGTIW